MMIICKNPIWHSEQPIFSISLAALMSTAGVLIPLHPPFLPTAVLQPQTNTSQYDSRHINRLSKRLKDGLLAMEHTSLNGDPTRHYPGCVNISFAYVEGESLLMALKDIALSSGSACTSSSLEPSYVLRALGNSDESAHSSIRFGIGRFTTDSEIDYVLKAVKDRVTFLRELSPLWELVQEGIDLNTIEWSQH